MAGFYKGPDKKPEAYEDEPTRVEPFGYWALNDAVGEGADRHMRGACAPRKQFGRPAKESRRFFRLI